MGTYDSEGDSESDIEDAGSVQSSRRRDVDRHVGGRIRQRRVHLGLSLQQLAPRIGVSSQQLRKYENAINRLPVGRLFDLAAVLEVHVSWFFEGLPDVPDGTALSAHQGRLLELMRCFGRIENEGHRAALLEMARMLATPTARGCG